MNSFFNTQHCPIGAHASVTLGFPGASGGLDIERCEPPGQEMLIALESAEQKNLFEALPFISDGTPKVPTFTDKDAPPTSELGSLRIFERAEVVRDFNLATDTWQAGDLRFTLYSPVGAIPDPLKGDTFDLRRALTPAVCAEVTVDNRRGTRARKLVLGFNRIDVYRGLRRITEAEGVIGIGEGRHMALVTDALGAWSALGMDWHKLLGSTPTTFGASALGYLGVVAAEVPAGDIKTFRFAYCFYRGEFATSGLDTRYYYTRWFDSIEAVASFALQEFDDTVRRARAADARLAASKLSAAQRFLVAHTTRSYMYSTQLLDHDGRPLWVVNEGEFNMMNTLDLLPDHALYEIQHHPWTVRNVLDQYVDRYSYTDDIRVGAESVRGGLSFSHDMGVAGAFSAAMHSTYERPDEHGCFSYMTMEELLNWVLTAGLYVEASGDIDWLNARAPTLLQCLESMERRDHPDPAQRIGVMRWDSSRCGNGHEITTYDCLDRSIGQASGNTYLASKQWAAGVVLAHMFERVGATEAQARAWTQATLTARTVTAAARADGRIPALLGDETDAVVLSVIEGLVYAWFGGAQYAFAETGPFGSYLKALGRHVTDHVLRDDACLYPDGGWRMTSRSANTFPAKAYVCQFIARHLLELPIADISQRADEAHVAWQTHPELSRWCWSEQVENGLIFSAHYYPRGVSCNVWLKE